MRGKTALTLALNTKLLIGIWKLSFKTNVKVLCLLHKWKTLFPIGGNCIQEHSHLREGAARRMDSSKWWATSDGIDCKTTNLILFFIVHVRLTLGVSTEHRLVLQTVSAANRLKVRPLSAAANQSNTTDTSCTVSNSLPVVMNYRFLHNCPFLCKN